MDTLVIIVCSFRPRGVTVFEKMLEAPNPSIIRYRKTGHHKANYFKLVRRIEGNGNGNDNVRTGVAAVTFNLVSQISEASEIIWFNDSGATCQCCDSDQCLSDVKVF